MDFCMGIVGTIKVILYNEINWSGLEHLTGGNITEKQIVILGSVESCLAHTLTDLGHFCLLVDEGNKPN